MVFSKLEWYLSVEHGGCVEVDNSFGESSGDECCSFFGIWCDV